MWKIVTINFGGFGRHLAACAGRYVIPNDGFSPVVTAKLMDTNHLPFKLQLWKQDSFEQ